MCIKVNAERLAEELEQLATFSDAVAPAITRVVFSKTDLKARSWLKDRCRAAGLEVREDAVGNTFARWDCDSADGPALGTGSHIDAIPNAGRYDGTVGVLGGLEAVRALRESNFVPKRPIELLLFTSEEPTRFGIGCLGSRLLSGTLDSRAANLKDQNGISLDEARKTAGFGGSLASVRLPSGYYAGFVELHIEQGPLLERANIQAGLVTSIAAPATLRIVIEGEGGHAGAVLMPDRRDALIGAAEVILTVENIVRQIGAIDTVATTGVCDVFPDAVNSIPSRVSLGIDIRDIDLARRDLVVKRVIEAASEISARRGLARQTETLNADAPAQCDPALVNALRTACKEENVSHMEMVSRAYHDSLFMSNIAPTAMLFIPCRSGVSHRPDEFASVPAITAGVRVLARTLALLSS